MEGAACVQTATGYTYVRREPEKTALTRCCSGTSRPEQPWTDEAAGRTLPGFVIEELHEFLDCGIIARGFAHLYCDTWLIVTSSFAICPASARRHGHFYLGPTRVNADIGDNVNCGGRLLPWERHDVEALRIPSVRASVDTANMEILQGSSLSLDSSAAVAEATAGWSEPDMILAFTSPVRSAGEVAAALAAKFPRARIAGCTTAGEHLTGSHTNGGLVVTGIASAKLRWATAEIIGLALIDADGVGACVSDLFAQLGLDTKSFDAQRYFCLLFIDGLSGQEERIAPLVADALDGIQMVGGSAGDDLKFLRTEVLRGGEAKADAAVLVLCECADDIVIEVLKHQHFVATQQMLAITRADSTGRRVYEIDGIPAAQAYARSLGISRADFDAEVAFAHPLAFEYHRELYVRSVQRIYEDDSIGFYCAIDEGMVVDVADRTDMVAALAGAADRVQRADLVIGANCILRALEADKAQAHAALGAELCRLGKHVIGFDTYGEQLDGLHINQTFVAIALREVTEAV